jgi:hypothetical protein
MAMPLGPTCDCSLCEIERRLLASLAAVEDEAFLTFTESSQLQPYTSVAGLVRLLRTSPAYAQSDGVLGELLKLRAARPAFTDSLLVLVFVPMLHRTVRRVVMWQPLLAEEDVVQQVIGVLLEFLRSDDMQVRQSHFAFAISRAVKRQVFAWAAREGIRQVLVNNAGDAFPPLLIEEPFERYAQLRHFLHRCATRGDLSDSELDLLIQFKLEGNQQRRTSQHFEWEFFVERRPPEAKAPAGEAPASGSISLYGKVPIIVLKSGRIADVSGAFLEFFGFKTCVICIDVYAECVNHFSRCTVLEMHQEERTQDLWVAASCCGRILPHLWYP